MLAAVSVLAAYSDYAAIRSDAELRLKAWDAAGKTVSVSVLELAAVTSTVPATVSVFPAIA